jgi:hypothetical protein
MSFLFVLKTQGRDAKRRARSSVRAHILGEDIEKGIALAGPIIGTFSPKISAILTDVAELIAFLEGTGNVTIGSLVQSQATISSIKQAAALRVPSFSERFDLPVKRYAVDEAITMPDPHAVDEAITMPDPLAVDEAITMPDPLPVPLPGGGPRDGYQWKFNERYYATRARALAGFQHGLAASPEYSVNEAYTPELLAALADRLYDWKAPGGPGVYGPEHVDFDQQCDYWQNDPYGTMYSREQIYGYQRVPVGTGDTTQPPNVVNPEDLYGPPVPGHYLLVTCDINKL